MSLIVQRIPGVSDKYQLLTGFVRFAVFKELGMKQVSILIEPEGIQKMVDVSQIVTEEKAL